MKYSEEDKQRSRDKWTPEKRAAQSRIVKARIESKGRVCKTCTIVPVSGATVYCSEVCHPYSKRNVSLFREYGITQVEYDRMYQVQGGKCKLCKRHQTELKSPLCVDHCHATNTVRGLLCRNCNNGLGMFQDDVELLKAAIVYLE